MHQIDKVHRFFINQGITGTFVFYGSCIEDRGLSKDVDCCIITEREQSISPSLVEKYKTFLRQEQIEIDEEVAYQDKLIISKQKMKEAIEQFQQQKSELVNLKDKYELVVNRLLINILTTKTKILGEIDIYKELSEMAWIRLIKNMEENGESGFDGFVDHYHVCDNYKNYFGFSPRVKAHLHNRYSYHQTDDLVIKLLKDNAYLHPQKVAVIGDAGSFTYQQLDELSDHVAEELLKSKSEFVIVDYPHRYEIIPIIYGIYKAGKVYVPVDFTSSEEEKQKIIKKFDNFITISDQNSDIDISEIFNAEPSYLDYPKAHLAYIIHTSGTSGEPKGVMVSRSNMAYLLRGCQKLAPVTAKDCYLFSTKTTFDVSISELFCFLYNAGSVYVYSIKNSQFYKKVPDLVEKYSITHIALSPSVFALLLRLSSRENVKKLDKVKYYMIAGEEFKSELVDLIDEKLTAAQILNVYGPTETTVYATFHLLSAQEKVVPIGRPFPGAKICIENEELYIGGEGVSEGYYKNDSKNREAFKIIEGERYYLTGDLVEWHDEELLYRGRRDDQIQIHGIRVELDSRN